MRTPGSSISAQVWQLIGVAFAEIVLLIVGILFALQIDNWNH